MASIFTRILAGELPGRFLWKDDACFSLMTIAPLRPGHAMVIPRQEVDHWIDLDDATAARLQHAAAWIGRAQMRAFRPAKIAQMIVGLEVRHVHLHLVPFDAIPQLEFSRQDPNATAVDLDQAAERIREELRALGRPEVAG
jgi:histidine triad (HIT) family protein